MRTAEGPRVSVILPFFDRASTLGAAIESVRAQTLTNWELLAVDDGSRDGSAELVAAFADPRIKLLRHGDNRGVSAARNTGLSAARGAYVALLDSDDVWRPEKLERQLDAMTQRGLDLCGCEYEATEGGRTWRFALPRDVDWRRGLDLRCHLSSGSTLVVRREVAEAVGSFDTSLRLYEDWDWVLRAVQRYRYGVVHEPLAAVVLKETRDAAAMAAAVERFLERNAAVFESVDPAYARRVRAHHRLTVAANACLTGDRAIALTWARRSAREHRGAMPGAAIIAAIETLDATGARALFQSLVRRYRALTRAASLRGFVG